MTHPENSDPNAAPVENGPATPGAGYPTAPGQPAPPYGQGVPDQQLPSYGQPAPTYGQDAPAYGQAAPIYGQAAPIYGQAPAGYAAPSYAAPEPAPGKTLGIVGFIMSFFGPLALVGLILSIIGMVQSKKAQVSNGFALAGIIISAVMVVGFILMIVLFVILAGTGFAIACEGYASGEMIYIDGSPVVCP